MTGWASICVLLFFMCNYALSQCSGPLSKASFQVLSDLFYATAGQNWTYVQPYYDFGYPWTMQSIDYSTDEYLRLPCEEKWQGITCLPNRTSSSSCFIRYLDMNYMNLYGTIPSSIGELQELGMLSFIDNDLIGSLPTEIGLLTELYELQIYFSEITGTIPSHLGLNTNLSTLVLTSNSFTGTIPTELGGLTSLSLLMLDSNRLSGTLPTELAKLTLSGQLIVYSNQLTGSLASLQLYSHLNDLSVDENYFTGHLPTEWSSRFLISFDAEVNYLSGPLPPNLVSLPLVVLSAYSNFFTGTLPTEFGAGLSYDNIDISYNGFSGTLPTELGNLERVSDLYFSSNLFTGTIPTELTRLSVIDELYLNNNKLTGSVPHQLLLMGSDFSSLFLDNNFLTGELPVEFGTPLSLMSLSLNNNLLSGIVSYLCISIVDISSNFFTGSLPATLASDCVGLNSFSLSSNYITGSLSSPWFHSPNLAMLDVGQNMITGPLQDIDDRPSFETFFAYSNLLTGTLPDWTDSVYQLILSSNSFTGTLPLDILKDGSNAVILGDNSLTGTIPEVFGNKFGFPQTIDFSYNSFSGTFPDSLFKLSYLQSLDVSGNLLTGGIQVRIENSTVQSLYAGSNYFTGDIDAVSQISNLTALGLELNCLTGGIEALTCLSQLQQMILFGNKFSGTLPSQISQMANLKSILIQNNSFVGQPDVIFDRSTQTLLTAVDLSSNDFTGPIPTEVFGLPLLESFAAIKTCFSGSLPGDAICNSSTLKYLLMDGAVSGVHCQRQLKVLRSSDAYLPANGPLQGGIPECIWGMNQLQALHLSSNGLSGTLATPPSSSQLTDIVLSYNQLSGTIPESLQTLPFDTLDLSNNRFKGTFQGLVNNSAAAITLENNRLSGFMSSSFETASDIKVMQGNLFDCNVAHPKPQNDPTSPETFCGSGQLDISLLVVLVLFGLIAMAGGFVWWRAEKMRYVHADDQEESNDTKSLLMSKTAQIVSEFSSWMKSVACFSEDVSPLVVRRYLGDSVAAKQLQSFLQLLVLSLELGVVLLAVTLIVCIPLYLLLKLASPEQEYSTHTYQYQWLVSAAFLSGVPPAVCLMVIWLTCCGYVGWRINGLSNWQRSLIGKTASQSLKTKSRWQSVSRIFLVCLLAAVNLVAMVALNYGYLTINLSTSFGQTVKTWSQVMVAGVKFLWDVFVIPMAVSRLRVVLGDVNNSSDKYVLLKFLCYITNYIVVPCVVTMVVDSNCFLDLFVPDQVVVEDFTFNLASLHPCVTLPSIKFNSTIGRQITLPSQKLCLSYGSAQDITTLFYPPFSYSFQCGSAILTSYVPVLLYSYAFQAFFVPLTFAALYLIAARESVGESTAGRVLYSAVLGFVLPRGTKKSGEGLLGASTVLATLLQLVFVLVTFGLSSPPLAATVLVLMAMEVGRYLLLVECYLRLSPRCDPSSPMYSEDKTGTGGLDEACRNVWKASRTCFWILFHVSSAFWALMCFDMVGNTVANSPEKAIWAPVVVLGVPVLLNWIIWLWSLRRTDGDLAGHEDDGENLEDKERGRDIYVLFQDNLSHERQASLRGSENCERPSEVEMNLESSNSWFVG